MGVLDEVDGQEEEEKGEDYVCGGDDDEDG